MTTADRYRLFADVEASETSPTYERLARAVAGDERLVGAIDELPEPKRQPNLLFAACRLLGAPMAHTAEFLDFVHSTWDGVRSVMEERSTQTNEAARCGTFLPLLARLEQPIALVEAGASAGLCLYPDRYRYDFGGTCIGDPDSPVTIEVATSGRVPVPSAVPTVAWRAGVDLNPLDVRREDDMAWLSACIWPEHDARRARLTAAADIARREPPWIVAGDAVRDLPEVLAAAPPGATTVVFHSAVLGYLSAGGRAAFAELMRRRSDAVWLSNEGPGVVPGLAAPLVRPANASGKSLFVLGVGGRDVAATSDPHGAWLHWLE